MREQSRAAGFAIGAIGLAAARLGAFAVAAALLTGCGGWLARDESARAIDPVETRYEELRALGDQIELTRSRGAARSTNGVALADLIRPYAIVRGELQRELASEPRASLSDEDARAWSAMRSALALYLPELSPDEPASDEAAPHAGQPASDEVDCRYDAEALAAGEGGFEALSGRIYACFSRAAHALRFEGETIDRLTVFGRLPLTDDAARREALWRAMQPIWEAVNADNGPRSPYRTLVRSHAARLARAGETLGASVRGIGVEPERMEQWLIRVLEQWRALAPDEPIEPWDFAYRAGRASRALSAAIPLAALRPINDRYYRDLGADPLALRVQYDVEPRASKDPVAFTTFGRRARFERGAWQLGEPWVFASYAMGGLDNLLELLHETGHAIHIAAIRTRPAFNDWPDSDIFTEGVADLATLELFEPRWQQRYIGASVPLADAIVAKYAGIAMDVAWALLEIRMHRAPDRDPNQIWSEICWEYFRIERHPELSWWAVRGQLIDAPGYMMNYAAGAILVADLRARARQLYGDPIDAGSSWYARVSEALFRFGLERSSREVIEAFLGRSVSETALLDDMQRALSRAASRDAQRTMPHTMQRAMPHTMQRAMPRTMQRAMPQAMRRSMPRARAALRASSFSAGGSRAGSPPASASRSRSSSRGKSAWGRRRDRARSRRAARSS